LKIFHNFEEQNRKQMFTETQREKLHQRS